MLVAVTGGADTVGRLRECRVRRLDLGVAVGTRSRDRCLILVRAVTIHAGGGSVHEHGWNLPLRLPMAAPAVFRTERIQGTSVHCVLRTAVAGESVTAQAIGARSGPEAHFGEMGGVFDTRLRFVTSRAATWGYCSDGGGRELMALVARDVLGDDVYPMTGGTPIGTPLRRHVNPSPRRPAGAFTRPA